MTKKYSTKRALIASTLMLCLCFSMLVGTTFAWFTDSAVSAGNIIQTGNLDVEMYWADGTKAVPTDDSGWKNASTGAIFNNVLWAKAGDVYNIGKSKIHVLREPDLSITREIFNNSSLVLRLDTNGKRILFMGDLTVEGGEEIFKNIPHDELKCDYVQMAHHGQGGVEKNVYEVISADYCLWCTPSWLWDNVGENGYDTNIFKTIIVRGWMSEIRAKKHYQNTFGDVIIEI